MFWKCLLGISGGFERTPSLREILSDWHNLLSVAGLIVLATVGIVLWLRRKPADPSELEHQRRSYLNRIGRIVEGQVLEIVDHTRAATSGKADAQNSGKADVSGNAKPARIFPQRNTGQVSNGSQKLLYYTYTISGVTYETAQDVTGLEERLHLSRIAAGQIASVKYDPSNPSNSILLADDWSGLH
jgi:hypothetical protein